MLYVILWLVLAIHNNVFNELQIYQSTYYKTILIVIEVLTIVYEYILNNFSILHFGQLYYRWTNHLRTWSNTVHSMHFIVDFVCMHVCMWFFPLHSVQSLSSKFLPEGCMLWSYRFLLLLTMSRISHYFVSLCGATLYWSHEPTMFSR